MPAVLRALLVPTTCGPLRACAQLLPKTLVSTRNHRTTDFLCSYFRDRADEMEKYLVQMQDENKIMVQEGEIYFV
eukprot:SAG31_NODE_2049_length_6564_cov_13.995824_9_plen_75_part_00